MFKKIKNSDAVLVEIPICYCVLLSSAKIGINLQPTKYFRRNSLFRVDLCQESVRTQEKINLRTCRLSECSYLCHVFFIVLDLRLTKIFRNSAEFHFFCPYAKYPVDNDARQESRNGIDDIVGIDINSSKTHNDIKGKH